jgi:hypothetical protein
MKAKMRVKVQGNCRVFRNQFPPTTASPHPHLPLSFSSQFINQYDIEKITGNLKIEASLARRTTRGWIVKMEDL